MVLLLSITKEESSSLCCFLHLPNLNEWKQLSSVIEALDSLLYFVCFFFLLVFFNFGRRDLALGYFLYTITFCSLNSEVYVQNELYERKLKLFEKK